MAASFTTETSHFFKIIIPKTLAKGKLYLPKKFVSNYGVFLFDNWVSLTLPSGEKWDAELKKRDGKFWFEKGWPEFVDFYSIKSSYLLVFRYKGYCSFHVVVLDSTATEIDYPLKEIRHGRQAKKLCGQQVLFQTLPKIEIEDDDSFEILHKNSSKSEEVSRLQEFNSTLLKMEKMRCPKREYKVKSKHCAKKKPLTTASQQEKVTEKANAFKSETQNPCFMATMRPSYIESGRRLNIPKSFAEKHLKETREISMQVSGGKRVWNVVCGVRWTNRNIKKLTELTGGWIRFARDNDLQEGDVCVFEIIETPKILLNVTIFRVLDDEE